MCRKNQETEGASMYNDIVYSAICRMLEHAGLSQRQASLKMDRNVRYISGIASRGSVPRVDTLVDIARACGYTVVLESDTDKILLQPTESKLKE